MKYVYFIIAVLVESTPIDKIVKDLPKQTKDGETAEENIEGRFFLKDKLCALGLADVSRNWCNFLPYDGAIIKRAIIKPWLTVYVFIYGSSVRTELSKLMEAVIILRDRIFIMDKFNTYNL